MMGMLFKLIACRPHSLFDLAQSYTNLLCAEFQRFGRSWKRRMGLYVVGVCSFMLGLIYTGVAVLLWGALPASREPLAWTYWAVPLAPFTLSLLCGVTLRWKKKPVLFEHL
jgi:hypothetical protein